MRNSEWIHIDSIKFIPSLKQGDKVEFVWYGASSLYVGRIEMKRGVFPYFVSEHNYVSDKLVSEAMRFYNSLESFWAFTYFKNLTTGQEAGKHEHNT